MTLNYIRQQGRRSGRFEARGTALIAVVPRFTAIRGGSTCKILSYAQIVPPPKKKHYENIDIFIVPAIYFHNLKKKKSNTYLQNKLLIPPRKCNFGIKGQRRPIVP